MSVNTGVAFTSYEVKDCLFDHDRTVNLQNAIKDTVKEGDVVLDPMMGS